jgi:hypothetical protein
MEEYRRGGRDFQGNAGEVRKTTLIWVYSGPTVILQRVEITRVAKHFGIKINAHEK